MAFKPEDNLAIDRFRDDLQALAQNKAARAIKMAMSITSDRGESYTFTRGGKIEMMPKGAHRGTEAPNQDIDFSRRIAVPLDYECGRVEDWGTDVRTSIERQSFLKDQMAHAHARLVEDIILSAALGEQLGKVATSTAQSSIALPASQKVATGSDDLTADKIKDALQIFQENDVDASGAVIFVNPQTYNHLLKENEIINSDFSTYDSRSGKLPMFAGFEIVSTPSLMGKTSSVLMTKRAIGLYMPKPMDLLVSRLPNNNIQYYAWSSLDAVRVHDEEVVEIQNTQA